MQRNQGEVERFLARMQAAAAERFAALGEGEDIRLSGVGIAGETPRSVRLPWSGTFHSVANRLIRRNARRILVDGGLDERFSVA